MLISNDAISGGGFAVFGAQLEHIGLHDAGGDGAGGETVGNLVHDGGPEHLEQQFLALSAAYVGVAFVVGLVLEAVGEVVREDVLGEDVADVEVHPEEQVGRQGGHPEVLLVLLVDHTPLLEQHLVVDYRSQYWMPEAVDLSLKTPNLVVILDPYDFHHAPE
jgi:hypothetical protein